MSCHISIVNKNSTIVFINQESEHGFKFSEQKLKDEMSLKSI